MTPGPLKNVAASVHQRLLNRARETGRPFNELLQYFAMERLLYRLSVSPHAPADLPEVVTPIAAFLAPVVAELAAGHAFAGLWRAPGPWTHGQ